jgi:adenylate kinase
MQERIVFVGGIHGAGKTTLSRRLALILPALHVTAGELIRGAGDPGEAVTLDRVSKAVADVDRNQERLLAGLHAYRNRATVGSNGLGVLLDGHFCLLDRHGAIADIPSGIFAAIDPVAVIFVEANAETVFSRLSRRDGGTPSLAIVTMLAERERARAAEICAGLGIQMWSVSGDADVDSEARRAAFQIRTVLTSGTA